MYLAILLAACLISPFFPSPIYRDVAIHGNKARVDTTADSSLSADCVLPTGWYYISDKGCRRQLGGSDDYYMVDPTPIVLDTNVADMQVHEYVDDAGENRRMLVLSLDAAGTQAWRIATRESIKKRLGFVYNNRLIYAPVVQSEITGGVTALNGQFSRAELDNVRKSIEAAQVVTRPDGYWITADVPWETGMMGGDTMAVYGSARILHFAAGGVFSMLSGMPYLAGDSISSGEPGYSVYTGHWMASGDTVIANSRFSFHTQGLVKEAVAVSDTLIVQRRSAGVAVLAGSAQRYGVASALTRNTRDFYTRLLRSERAAR